MKYANAGLSFFGMNENARHHMSYKVQAKLFTAQKNADMAMVGLFNLLETKWGIFIYNILIK